MIENKNQNNTKLSKLGEFGLIEHITSNFKIKNQSTVLGVGR
jgi:thiamine-monophosphate kinase